METTELKLFSLSEAAKVLNIGRDTLKKLIAAGDMGFIKVGKTRKIPYKEVLRFLNENIIRENTGRNKALTGAEIMNFFNTSNKTKSLKGSIILEKIIREKLNGNSNKKGGNPPHSMV